MVSMAPTTEGSAEQHRLDAIHERAVAEVPLEPQPGLGYPGPVDAAMPRPPGCAHLGHRPPCGALRAGIAHGDQSVVGDVGAHLALGSFHPLLELGQERVDDTLPPDGGELTQRAGVTPGHPVGDGLVVTAGQLGCVPETPGQVEGFEYLHDLLGMLHVVPPGAWVLGHTECIQEGPPTGGYRRSADRCWGDLMAAAGEFS